jgi:TRAP-type C4-dicarboxylate transport system permease small subunit
MDDLTDFYLGIVCICVLFACFTLCVIMRYIFVEGLPEQHYQTLQD